MLGYGTFPALMTLLAWAVLTGAIGGEWPAAFRRDRSACRGMVNEPAIGWLAIL
jgi:hypothetical protein